MSSREVIAARRARVVTLTRQGASISEIAVTLGITSRSVCRIRSELGANVGRPQAPLTETELRTAATLLDEGCPYSEVARTIGRAPRSIRRYFPGRGWSPSESGCFAVAVRRANQRMSA